MCTGGRGGGMRRSRSPDTSNSWYKVLREYGPRTAHGTHRTCWPQWILPPRLPPSPPPPCEHGPSGMRCGEEYWADIDSVHQVTYGCTETTCTQMHCLPIHMGDLMPIRMGVAGCWDLRSHKDLNGLCCCRWRRRGAVVCGEAHLHRWVTVCTVIHRKVELSLRFGQGVRILDELTEHPH